MDPGALGQHSGLLAIAAVGVVLLLLWRQQRRAHQLALAIHTAEQDRLLKYFYELPFMGMAITSPTTSAGCASITSYARF